MKTTSQQFAETAFTQVRGVAEAHKKGSPFRQKYGSMSHRLPILIRTSGLAQALAFVQAKKEDAYKELLDHLAAAVQWPGAENGEGLATSSRSEQLDGYILLTRRITTALTWYKRFAESILDVKPTEEAPEGEAA